MKWTDNDTNRFAELRLKALDETLTSDEQRELNQLQSHFEMEEARQLAPSAKQLRDERRELQKKLAKVNVNNEQLALLLQQHEQLVVDARAWLTDFYKRQHTITRRYSTLKASGMLSV